MISLKHTALLAIAKMRLQKRQTIILIVVTGILFGFLLAATIIWKSVAGSAAAFSNGVTAGRQFVLASKIDSSNNQLSLDPGLIQQAESAFKADVDAKKAYAASIGYDYNSSSEIPAVATDVDAQGKSFKKLNLASPLAQQLLRQARQKSGIGLPEISVLTTGYETKKIFEVRGMNVVDGKLTSDPARPASAESILSPQGQLPYIVDESVLEPYILKRDVKSGDIPIFIPFSAAETELGLATLPANASTQDRLSRLQQVKAMAGSIRFTLCYKNGIELRQAAQKQEEMTSAFCGAPAATQDDRSLAQKSQDDKRDVFNVHFGVVTKARQQLITYQVVGIMPDSQVGLPSDNLAKVILSSLSPPGFGFSAITSQAYDTVVSRDDRLRGIFTASDSTADVISMHNFIIEFTNQTDAARFLHDNACDTNKGCDNKYTFIQFGSNSIQLALVTKSLRTVSLYAAAVVAFIAVIILGGTFAKLIADSRRETAIFRAFGAKRLDIVAIYTVYALFLSLLTALFAISLAYVIAWAAHVFLAGQFQNELQLTYGFADTIHARLIEFAPVEIIVVGALVLVSGVLGMLLSLAGNIKRDMAIDLKES